MRSGLKNAAGIMISTGIRFAVSEDRKVSTKPEEGECSSDMSAEERAELFSSARLVLKKSPENRPVRKMNMNIRLTFFICVSPFYP